MLTCCSLSSRSINLDDVEHTQSGWHNLAVCVPYEQKSEVVLVLMPVLSAFALGLTHWHLPFNTRCASQMKDCAAQTVCWKQILLGKTLYWMNIELGLGGHMKIMKSKVINRLTQKSLKILDTFASTNYYWGEKKFLFCISQITTFCSCI